MPFGFTNAPASFQSLMNHVFQPFLWKFIFVFFKDILVYSMTMEKHMVHLHQVFQVLDDICFHVNPKKCEFWCKQLEFLGYWISYLCVQADVGKIDEMQKLPLAKKFKQLRGFLGTTG